VRLVLWCLALGALPVPGQVAGIAVYTQFQHQPPAGVVTSLEHEVETILAPLGFELQWRSLDAVHGNEVSQQLAVVKFKGTCDAQSFPVIPFHSGGLGWTHVSDGEILPFMDVDCDHIRGFVRHPLSATAPPERDEMLGRALARVVVHELYHILARTARHGSGPADHRAYTVQELTEERFELERGECRIVNAAGAHSSGARQGILGWLPGSSKAGQAKFVEKKCSVCHGARGEGTSRGPALRVAGRMIDAAELATRLGMESRAMCRRADQLKIPQPVLGASDIHDLVQFLNASLY